MIWAGHTRFLNPFSLGVPGIGPCLYSQASSAAISCWGHCGRIPAAFSFNPSLVTAVSHWVLVLFQHPHSRGRGLDSKDCREETKTKRGTRDWGEVGIISRAYVHCAIWGMSLMPTLTTWQWPWMLCWWGLSATPGSIMKIIGSPGASDWSSQRDVHSWK